MVTDKDKMKKNFKAHIENTGGQFSDWYSGITNDPKKRVFDDHKVKDAYIYDNAGTKENAEDVEDYLINTLRTKGGSRGGKTDSTWVYSYKIKDYTVEDV